MGPGYDAVVVGAGIGGLVTGALLADRGRRVLVTEASDRIGGYQRRFELDGFQIEPHFHFLQEVGPGRPVRRLLDDLGIELEWRLVDPILRVSFPDRVVTVPNDRAAYIASLVAEFPHEERGIGALFAATEAIYRAALRMPTLSPVLVRYGADTVEDFVSRFVADAQLRTIVGAWAAYFGYGTGQIAAVAIAVFNEGCFDGGVFHPVGGIEALTSALRRAIESRGGVVALSSPVERVTSAGGVVTGVDLAGGRHVEAPVVVSNVDALTTLRDLAGLDCKLTRRLGRITPFRAPFSVFLGLRGEGGVAGEARLEQPPVQVVFPGYDTEAQDRAQLQGRVEQAPVSFGIPTVLNPELAPPGSEIVLLYTFLTESRIDELLADPVRADDYARRLVSVAARAVPGLGDRVATMATSVSASPVIYGHGTRGALGWAPTPETLLGGRRVAALLRTRAGAAMAAALIRLAPAPVSRLVQGAALPGPATPLAGLYLVGQWTGTGAGMNNVCRSAQRAAELVLAKTAAGGAT